MPRIAAAARTDKPEFTSDNEYLTFKLGAEEYGIDILKVQEIRGYDTITRIANSPDFLKGVVNLRGTIVPIVDMRLKFNLGRADYDAFTVVFILNLGRRVVGIVVDGVSDVVSLSGDQIKSTPSFPDYLDTSYILGLGTIDDRMLILMDVEKLMLEPSMGLLDLGTAQ